MHRTLPKKVTEVPPENYFEEVDETDSDDYKKCSKNSERNVKYNQGNAIKNHVNFSQKKTIKELQKSMTNIGLNPESTSIGVEEMKKAMKSLKLQQKGSPRDRTGDYPIRVKSNEEDEGDTDEVTEDISEYTLSESLQMNRNCVERSNASEDKFLYQFIDHSKGKSAAAKKRYAFDEHVKRLVEIAPTESDEEDSSNSSDLTNSWDINDDDERRENKARKSQLDLVREKTTTELMENMADIGLNPESTAIGLEEMGRALKHLKSRRITSAGDKTLDQEQFEEVRNAAKSYANFAATKSTIDRKLEAISNLNTNKTEQSAFGKIFTAFKVSGKGFKKRVVSAVKKREKEDISGDDENDAGGDAKADKKRKRKTMSARVLRTIFFKPLWTRKKKLEGDAVPSAGAAEVNGADENDEEGESDMSSEEESGEEIKLPPYMTRSKPILPRRRSSSFEWHRRRNSTSKTKPLKRLNSRANDYSSPQNPNPNPKSEADRKSEESYRRTGDIEASFAETASSKDSSDISRYSDDNCPNNDDDDRRLVDRKNKRADKTSHYRNDNFPASNSYKDNIYIQVQSGSRRSPADMLWKSEEESDQRLEKIKKIVSKYKREIDVEEDSSSSGEEDLCRERVKNQPKQSNYI